MARRDQPFPGDDGFLGIARGETDGEIARAALEIARDANPGLDIGACLERLAELSARVRGRCPSLAKARTALGHLRWVLSVEERFRGNDANYYDPDNSRLDRVIETRRGIPITLSIVYMTVGAGIGLALRGVNAPGHFLLRLESDDGPLFVDAFAGGEVLDAAACRARIAERAGSKIGEADPALRPCDERAIIRRLLTNLKLIHLQADDILAALPVVRRLAFLDPEDPIAVRDLGLLAYRAGRPGQAIRPLEDYVRKLPNADDSGEVAEILRAARREVAASN